MPYDALGNYIPGDEPTVDQMQYELAKKGQLPRPLDKVTEHFKNIVTQFNPIMMPKMMQDVGTMGTNIASTIVSPYADILHNVQAAGAAGLHRLAGDEQSALEAEARQRQVTPGGLYREPSLPVVREAEQGLGRAFEASKLPPLGPGSGMPGSAPISPRPMFTPNDLRVVGAEATRVGRQIGDIPTDFVNAQSGFQRIDPVTGQPVLGARIQSGVDRLGDIMEQRRMQGLTPIPGLPAALQPETSMYAVRPQGTRLTTPVVPATARGFSPPIDPANDMFREVTGMQPDQSEATPTVLHSLNSRVQFGNAPSQRNSINAFRSFVENKAKEMYPEAETPRQALEIFNAMYYDTPSRHVIENKMFDEFIQTPEGQQLLPNAASSEEMAKRHNAAAEGLKNMWGKYLIKNLGTEGNPLVKMAAEKGLTQLPAEDVIRVANEEAYAASENRQKSGMPIQGSFAIPITETQTELQALNTKIEDAAKRQNDLFQAAHVANVDPASIPEYLEARKQVETDTKKRNALQKKLDNLTLASAYEALEDAAVRPAPAEALLKNMQPSERPFYPGLKESAARGETGYKSGIGAIENTGFIQAAEKFYNDVLQGKIPADKAATYPVDKYIRENAEARIKVEQAEQAKLAAHKKAVMASLKASADALPADKKFGNVGVVELTKDTPLDIANKEVAASTEALDICIGEGGSGKGTKNLFTGKKDPRYTPIVNLLTGEPNPNATRNTSGWVSELQRGEQLPMFRDLETGMPVAALQFHVASGTQSNGQPMYNIGYASGEGNGRIDTKYVNGVRDYLNARADDIAGIGHNLEDNTGIYDTKNVSSLYKARRYAQVSENDMKGVDWNTMPRFMTAEDIKQAVKSNVRPTPVVTTQTPTAQADVTQLQTTLINNIDTVVDDAVLNSNLDVPEDLENRLHAVFARMQQEYFPTFSDDPIPTMNRALDFLRDQIDRRVNNASELSQEMVNALDNYAAELEAARDELLAQQQRAVQPAPQATPTDITTVIDNVLATASRELGANVRIEAERLLHEISRTYNPTTQSAQFRTTIRGYASPDVSLTQSELVRRVMETLADRLDEQATQQQAPAQQPNIQDEVQQHIQLNNVVQPRLFAGNARVVNDALRDYANSLQVFMSNQALNGLSPMEVAENATRVINEYRNAALRGPMTATENFTPDQLSEYVQELRQMIDSIGRWIVEQNRLQRANLPAEVQQNIERRNQHITDAYQTALTPNTNMPAVDEALSEFSDMLSTMATNMFGNGYNASEIAENLADRVHTEHMSLVTPDRIDARGLTPTEADVIRSRLNTAYGNLNTIREMGVPAPEPLPDLNFEPDVTHPANQPAQSPQRDVFDASVGNFINRQIQELRDVGTPAANNAVDYVLSTIARVAASANMFNDPQEAVRIFRHGATGWDSAPARQALRNIARFIELNHPTMQAEVPANEPYTMQSAVDMARDLFEQERIDANNFDIRSIEDSIHALREGLFDDERIRRLSPRQQAAFSEDVAFRLQNMLDELRGRRPDRNLVADPADARRAIDNAIANIDNDYGIDVANDVSMITNSISEHVNPGDELSEYVYQLRRGRPGMSEDVREALDHVAEELESIATERQQQTQPMDLNTAYNTAEAYLNERLEDIGLDSRFADLTDAERAGIVNTYEDELGRTLNGLSDDDFLHVLRRLRENNPIPYEHQQALTPVPAQPATAPYVPLSNDVGRSSDIELLRHMDERENLEVQNALNTITDVNSPEQIQNIIGLARTHLMGPWQNFTAVQRERLARGLTQYLHDNTPPNTPPATDNVFGATGQTLQITDRDRELYSEFNDMLDNAIEEGYPLPDLGDNESVARLILNNEIGGEIGNATDAERRRLASLVRRYGAHGTLPRGHRDGGRIRAYKKGGTVRPIPSVEQMKYELMMRRA